MVKWVNAMLTHYPVRKGCKTCEQFKKRHAPFKRGLASCELPAGAAKGPFVTFDWACPSTMATNGDRFLAVIGWVGEDVTPTKGSPAKKGAASGKSGMGDWTLTFHSGREGVLTKGGKGKLPYEEGVVGYLISQRGFRNPMERTSTQIEFKFKS